MAVRFRWSCQVEYERYADFYDIQRKKSEVAGARGWVPSTFWTAIAGNLGDFYLEREYPNLETFASEQAQRDNDYEFMKLMRESYRHAVQGSIRVELFETAGPGI